MFVIFRTLLMFVHFLYSLRLIIYKSIVLIRRKFSKFWYKNDRKREVEVLLKNRSRFNKLPKHLVILSQNEDCIKDSIQIIGWCITLGIPFISFYSRDGIHETIVKEEFVSKRPELLEYVTWSWSYAPSKENGITGSNPKIRILLPSHNGGKGEIVSLTQNLAQAVIINKLDVELINENLIAEKMKSLNGIPDPDLAVIHGHTCSTYGFLPWHTRTTEFSMLPVCCDIVVEDFIYILEKYSKSEQRYGK